MADDVRIVIDADASKVVIESAKGKRAIKDLSQEVTRSARATDGASQASARWAQTQAAGAAAGRRQVQTLHELGRAARVTTLAVGTLAAAGLTHLIRTGVDFEKQMSAVNAVTNATGKQFEQLRKQALDAGQATAFSAGEAAKAQEELAKGGLSVANILSGGLDSALALAAAGSLELGEAAAITANAMNLFALNGKESGKVADALATAANKTSADVADFGLALAQGGSVAKSAGLSFTETVVALEALAASGIKGSDAGTSLKTALIQLIKPTDEQAGLAKKLGLSFVGANGEMRSLADISEMLRERLKGQGEAQRTATLATLAGTDGVRTLTALYDAGPGQLKRWEKGVRETGTAQDVAKKKIDNVAGAIEQLTGSIATVEAALFTKFQKPLKAALLEATSEINSKGKQVEEFFDRVFEMPEFQAADVAGKLAILLREFDQTGLPDEMGDLIVEGFQKGLDAAIPVMAKGAAVLALIGARSFFTAFEDADPVSKVIMALFVAHKTGMLAAIRASGAKAGAAYGSSAAAAASATGGGVLGGKRGAKAKSAAKGVGGAALAFGALDAATAKDLNLGERGQQFVSSATFGLLGLESGTEHAEKAEKAIAALRDRLRELANAGQPFGDGGAMASVFAGIKDIGKADDDDDIRRMEKAMAAYGERLRIVQDLSRKGLKLDIDSETTGAELRTISTAFERMRNSGIDSIKDVRSVVRDNMRVIAANTKDGSADANAAMATNFRLAATAVEGAMKRSEISTAKGLREIERLMSEALKVYGFTGKQAKNIAAGQSYIGGAEEGSASAVIARARGGLATVGRPGAAGRDTVPAILNGQPSMIAEGEQVAVFNRHQQAAMNARLADQGGLAGFFARNQRPHYMASGGIAGYAPGGIVPIPGMPGESIHRSILPDVLRIIRQYSARVTDGYATSGHAADGEHPKGLAVDLVPGKGGSWDDITALAKWAEPTQGNPRKPFRWVGYTGDPNHGPGNHLHLSWLAGAGLGGSIGSAAKLKRVLMERGDLGAVTAIGQRALDIARAAAQSRLDSMGGGAGSGGEGAELGSAAAEAGGDGAALMREISKRHGWNFADWWEIDRRETGHGSNLVNPTSTARLRGQFLDMNYGKYGPGSDPRQNPSMAQQIESMGRYIRERYGNPTKALAHHDAHNWYAAGGIVGPKRAGGAGRTATPPRAGAGKFRPLKYRGKVLDAVPELGQIASLDEQLERADRRYGDMDRTFNLTDEEALSTDAAGNEARNEPDIARRVSEIDQLIGQKGASAKLLEDQRKAAQVAARKVAEAIAEREERIADVLDAAKRNKRRIDDAQDDLNDERRGRGWQGKVSANEQRIDSLQDDLRAETAKKNGSRTVKLGLRNQIDELTDENKRLRKTKPKGGDGARVKRLVSRLDRLRDEREELVGTRSVAKDAQADGGMLGSATKGLASYREAQGGADGRGGLVELLRRTLPDGITDIGLDVAELRKEREKWTGTAAPAANLPTAGDDGGLAGLLRQQLDAERARSRMLGEQFGVFAQFAPLVGLRMQGSFARGLDKVRETGLAVIHKGETIGADPKGPFGSQLAAGAPVAPAQVTIYLDGDASPLVRLVRAEVNGQAARVVSEQLGRRTRLIASAPGGGR